VTASGPIDIDCEQQHASLNAPDLAAAIEFYTAKLGFRVSFTWGDPPTMAGVNLGSVQMFLQHGQPHPSGCSVTFVVSDADALHDFQRANGVEIIVPIADRDYGIRDYRVRDLNGYELSFGQHLFNDGPPIDIERVDVPLRLETRLAALLTDLAAHKRMGLTGLMEETLLHTLEGVGPHTKSDLRVIETLRQRHGIDYDSHGSYRFRETEGR
jgi:catechol 2,3-dioxygenase-like lactoylglutathione lyase family enzyme